MNILLVLIIIGLCIAQFGFWTVVGSFFAAILWIIVIIALIIASFYAVVILLDIINS